MKTHKLIKAQLYTILIVFLYSLCPICLYAQNTSAQTASPAIIRGKIVDEKTKQPIVYATIRIGKMPMYMNTIKAIASDNEGRFEVKVEPGTYILTVSAIGYQFIMTPQTTISAADIASNEMPVIKMKEKIENLEEVTVKPLVSVSSTEIIYNLDQDPERETSSIYDLIDRVPMIETTPDGRIYIGNPENSILLVRNDKKDILFSNEDNKEEVLKALPAKGFSRVKVKLMPEERYGSYKYVISFDTDKSNQLFGVVNPNTAKYDFSDRSYYLSPDILGSYNRLRFKMGILWGKANIPQYDNSLEQLFHSDERRVLQEEKSKKNNTNYMGNIGFSYDLGTRHFLTGSFKFQQNDNRNRKTIFNRQTEKETESEYIAYTLSKMHNQVFNGELNYQYNFKKPERILNVVYNFNSNPTDRDTDAEIESSSPVSAFPLLNGNERTNLHTLQMHYSDPISKHWLLETGIKYLYREQNTQSEYRMYGTEQTQMGENLEVRKHIVHNYVNLRYTCSKIAAQLNLNTEYVNDGRGTRLQQGNELPEFISETGFMILPSFKLSTALDKRYMIKHISANYFLHKMRPPLYMMSTGVNYSNPQFLSTGNPKLKAEDKHTLTFSFSTNSFTFNLFGDYSPNKITSDWYTDKNGRIVASYANAGTFRSGGVSLSSSFHIKKVSLMFMGSGNYSYNKNNENVTEQCNVNLLLNANIPIYKTLSIFTVLSYYDVFSSGTEINGYHYPFSLQATMFLELFKRRLKIEATAHNLLNFKSKYTTEVHMPEFTQIRKQYTSVVPLAIKLSWRFGSFKVKPVRQAHKGALIDDAWKE